MKVPTTEERAAVVSELAAAREPRIGEARTVTVTGIERRIERDTARIGLAHVTGMASMDVMAGEAAATKTRMTRREMGVMQPTAGDAARRGATADRRSQPGQARNPPNNAWSCPALTMYR